MTNTIDISFQEIMRQPSMTVSDYLGKSMDTIDKHLGDGYAKQNPLLLGALVLASVLAEGEVTIAQQIRAGLDGAASDITEAIEDLRMALPE